MHISDDLRTWCIDVLRSNSVQQVAPLIVLIVVPACIFFLANAAKNSIVLRNAASMGIESLGVSLPWAWSSSIGSTASAAGKVPSSQHDKRKSKKHIRTRAEQLAENGSAKPDSEKPSKDDGYYPGLVNISGTYCFMNSTLQALSSLTYLQPHIDAIHAKAEALDVPTPVIDAIQDLFRRLNTPRSSYHSIRPLDIIEVLSKQTEGRPNSLFYSREHQDAQELFQVLSECIKNETAAVDKEGYRDRGLGGLSQTPETMREIGKSVFDGLTANRRSCCVCGYTEAVMHFAFDNWQLAVPRLKAVCRLEECLEEYTRLEILRDCICRKCSIQATHRRLLQEVQALEDATQPSAKPSPSKKRRLKEVRRMEARVKAAIEEGRIEDDIKDVRLEKVFSIASTKQAMIARPPQVLALHINRSMHYGQYATKNSVHILFPEILDLTPYTTSGSLSTVPTSAISTPPPMLPRSTTPTPSTFNYPHTLYRLAAVVCHYGQHSFGHYICYRRRPRDPNLEPERRWEPPTLVDPLRPESDDVKDKESLEIKKAEEEEESAPRYVFEDSTPPGKGWLRISDDAIREVGLETVLLETSGAFMLYYERVVAPRGGVYGFKQKGSPRGSEETLKPEMRTVTLNGSVRSLVSEVGVGVMVPNHAHGEEQENGQREVEKRERETGVGAVQIRAPRIVRSVAAGRGRSSSATASDRAGSVSLSSSPSTSLTLSSSPPSTNGDIPQPNGHIPHSDEAALDPSVPSNMTASAPSILSMKSSSSSLSTSTSTASGKPQKDKSKQPPPRIHSPQPHHPPSGPSVSSAVGLKA